MQVIITKMSNRISRTETFTSEAQARNYFMEFCDENNIPCKYGDNEAGGIGYDYRIEISELN